MSEYTPEQIISAKWLERTDIIPKEARIPPYEDRHGHDWELENEALIILAALEAAEQERDELLEAAKIDLTEKRIVTDELRIDRNAWKAYAAKLEKAGDGIRASFTTFNAEDRENALADWDATRKEKP